MIPQNHPDSRLSQFLLRLGLGSILKGAGIRKAALGVAPQIVVQFLLGLIFSQRNFWRWLATRPDDDLPFRKDVVYRFLNDPRWHWRRLLRGGPRRVPTRAAPLPARSRLRLG